MLIQENHYTMISTGIVVIYFGIMVNGSELLIQTPYIPHNCEFDTEVVLIMLRAKLQQNGSLDKAFQEVHREIEGSALAVLMLKELIIPSLVISNGSLYTCSYENALIITLEKFEPVYVE